jgi:hypothetical protein
MSTINLLDFFRSGRLGSVEIGMTKEQILAHLGTPDNWWRVNLDNHDQSYTQSESPIWKYAGIQLYWYGTNERLSLISIKPEYLYKSEYATQLKFWFYGNHTVPTMKRLRAALEQEAIPFQDTGMEISLSQYDSAGVCSYKVVPFEKENSNHDRFDAFGTLVLKSGVQVRYDDYDQVEHIILGSSWTVKGSEDLIKW